MANRIIETLDQFIFSVPTAAGVENFADLDTYCASGELWLKRNVLGTNMYNRVIDEINGDTSTSTGEGDFTLINICRNIVANHAYWDAIPFLDVIHTDAGFGVIMSANKAPASKERIERLRAQCLARRDSEIENLMAYLEANEVYWEDWKGDDVYSTMYESLLPTLEIFNKYHRLADRATFDKLHSAVVTVQNTWVADTISKVYLDELVEAQKDADLTADDDAILPMLRDAIAKLSLAWGIDNMSINIDTRGVVMLNDTNLYVGSVAMDARLDIYKATYKKAGMAMLNRVFDYMVKNIDDFTTFAASDEYAAMLTAGFENEADNTMFSSIF